MTMLVLSAYIKLHMGSHLVPTLLTLNDLEWLFYVNYSKAIISQMVLQLAECK